LRRNTSIISKGQEREERPLRGKANARKKEVARQEQDKSLLRYYLLSRQAESQPVLMVGRKRDESGKKIILLCRRIAGRISFYYRAEKREKKW
jgi:hypothetical protein